MRSLSYRNQSIDLHSKSTNWFLYVWTSVYDLKDLISLLGSFIREWAHALMYLNVIGISSIDSRHHHSSFYGNKVHSQNSDGKVLK